MIRFLTNPFNIYSNVVTRNISILYINSFSSALLGAIFWIIAARYYRIEDIGLTSAIISSATLVATLANPGINSIIMRYLPVAGYFSSKLIIIGTFAISILSFIAAWLFCLSPFGESLLGHQNGISYFMFSSSFVIFSVGISIITVQNAIFTAQQRGFIVLFSNQIGLLFRFLILIPLCIYNSIGLFLLFEIGTFVSIILGWKAWEKIPVKKLAILPELKKIIHYGFTAYVSGILSQGPSLAYPALITIQVSAKAAGAFNFAWLAASILLMFPIVAGNVLLADWVANPERAEKNWRKSSIRVIGIMILMAFTVYGSAIFMLPHLLPNNQTEILKYLPLLLLGSIPYSIVRLQSTYFALRGLLKSIIVLNAIVALGGISLPLILIKYDGVVGVEIGWIIGQCMGLVLGIFIVKNEA